MTYLKYILGVNKHTSNLAVLSETGRFPMYFSIILSIVKYLHRLENTSNLLLKEAYCLSKALHNKGTQTWYTSAIYILRLLNINITSCRNMSENQLVCMVKKYLIKCFKTFWYKQREGKSTDGKLDTYFSIKKEFNAEPYLMLETFHVRKAISKLRLSAHNLLIETGRYAKPRSLPRSERICKHCNFNCIENEFHFLSRCSLYETERAKLYNQVHHKNNNFISLSDNDKARWLLLQEDRDILFALGTYIHNCFEKRNKKCVTIND